MVILIYFDVSQIYDSNKFLIFYTHQVRLRTVKADIMTNLFRQM